MKSRRWTFVLFLFLSALWPPVLGQSVENVVWIGFLGDSGTGKSDQAAVRDQLTQRRKAGQLDYVFLLGDNVYGSGAATDIDKKYFSVYARLMLRGVRFHSALGNHDVRKCKASSARPLPRDASAYMRRHGCDVAQHLDEENWFGYRNSHRYYSVQSAQSADGKPLVEIFVLDSNTLRSSQTKLDEDNEEDNDDNQIEWLKQALKDSSAMWKIVAFHHPLHTPEAKHKRETGLEPLEDIFEANGVDAVFQAHNHLYARLEPQRGIRYFVSGGGGKGVYKFKPDDGYVAPREDGGKFHHFVHVRASKERFEYCAIDAEGRVRDGGSFAKGDARDELSEPGRCPYPLK